MAVQFLVVRIAPDGGNVRDNSPATNHRRRGPPALIRAKNADTFAVP
jgi:hypothetical protein